jgi:hypothetical protein
MGEIVSDGFLDAQVPTVICGPGRRERYIMRPISWLPSEGHAYPGIPLSRPVDAEAQYRTISCLSHEHPASSPASSPASRLSGATSFAICVSRFPHTGSRRGSSEPTSLYGQAVPHPEASRGSILVPARGWIASGECRHRAKVLSQSRPE